MKLQDKLVALTESLAETPKLGQRSHCRLEFLRDGSVARSPDHEAFLKKRNSLDEDSCCSFNEWSGAGYRIKKGEVSMFRDILGVPQFTKEQTHK
jgi:hypothetical protein